MFVCLWRNSPQWARASSFTVFLDHTQRRTTVGRTPLDELSARRRVLYLYNTHHSQQTDFHAPGGIRTHNLSRRATADLRRSELSYLAPLGIENISAPYFKQCFFQVGGGGGITPRQSNTTPSSPKTEITNILFYMLNFASIIKFKM